MDTLLTSLRNTLANESLSGQNVNDIVAAMEAYQSDPKEWEGYAHWSGER